MTSAGDVLEARELVLEYLDACIQSASNGAGPPPLDVELGDRTASRVQAALRTLIERDGTPITYAMLRLELKGNGAAVRLLEEIATAGGVVAAMPSYIDRLRALERSRTIFRVAQSAQAKAHEGRLDAAEDELRQLLEASMPAADVGLSWHPVSLGPELASDARDSTPVVMRRSDGLGLAYRGRVNGFHGETECGKTFIALQGCAEEMSVGNCALFVDFEDQARTAIGRLRSLGVPDDVIASRFIYVAPSEPLNAAGRAALNVALERQPTIAVIDGVTDALHMHGLKTNSAEDIAAFYRLIARPISLVGAAVITIDHVTKDRETRGRYALGSEHKLAGITGAAYTIEVIKPFARGRSGLVRMKVAKDRLGEIRPHEIGGTIAEIEIVSDEGTDGVAIAIRPPGGGPFRPTTLMERVSRVLEGTGGYTRSQLRREVRGRGDGIDKATDVLVSEGYVEESVEGSAKRFVSVRIYRVEDDPEVSDA